MPQTLTILARKPRGTGGAEFVVIDRGEGAHMRYVSATVDAISLAGGEWYWGHYFATLDEAMSHFNLRRSF